MRSRMVLLSVFMASLPATAEAQIPRAAPSAAWEQDDSHSRILRYGTQAIFGFVGGWAIGGAVFKTVYDNAGDRTTIGDAGISRTANWALLGASSVGVALGTYLGGELGAGSSLIGSFAGSMVATLPFVLGVGDPYLPYFVFTLGTGMQITGGILGGAWLDEGS